MQEIQFPKISEEFFLSQIQETESWVGLLNYRASDKRIVMTKGNLFCVASLQGPEGFPAQTVGKYVWEALSDKYYFNSKGKIIDCLKESLKAAKYRLISFLKKDELFSDKGVDLSLAAVVIWEDLIYVGIIGEPLVYLVREGKAVDIASAFISTNLKSTVHIGSGKLQSEDFLIVATPKIGDRFEDISKKKDIYWASTVNRFTDEKRSFDYDEGMYMIGYELSDKELSQVIVPQEEEKPQDLVRKDTLPNQYDTNEPVDSELSSNISKATPLAGLLSSISVAGTSLIQKAKDIKIGSYLPFLSKEETEEESREFEDLGKDDEILSDESPELVSEMAEKISDSKTSIVDEDTSELQAKSEILASEPRENFKPEMPGTNEETDKKDEQDFSVEEMVPEPEIPTRKMSFHERMLYQKKEPREDIYQKQEKKVVSQTVESSRGKSNIWYKDLFKKITTFVAGIQLFGDSKKYYVGKREQPIARYVLIGVIILSVAVFTYKRISENQYMNGLKNDYQTRITALNENVNQIKSKIPIDPAGSRGDLITALTEANEITKIPIEDNNAQEKVTEIQELINSIEKKVNVSEEAGNFSILADAFAQFGEGSQFDDIAFYNDVLYITDSKKAAVYTYNVVTKATGKIPDADNSLKQPYLLETSELGNVFIFDKEQGMIKYEPKTNKLKILAGLSPRNLSSIIEFTTFSKSENLYFLDPTATKILKSVASGAGYTAPDEYIEFGGFNLANDIAIDGNVFVATKAEKKVYKFYRMKEDNMQITGLFETIGNPGGIFIKPGFNNIYVLDKSGKRIVVLETPDTSTNRHAGQAVLVKQYFYAGKRENIFTNLKEIVVSGTQQESFVLENNQIYKIQL